MTYCAPSTSRCWRSTASRRTTCCGTISRLAEQQGVETLIVTGDKDLLQLVSEHTLVQLPGRRSGEVELYDIQAVRDRFGFDPLRIVDFKALVGDKSDNIPGVAGVGEKSATDLIQKYGTLDNIYAHLAEITSKRTRMALEANRDAAYLSYKLAQIVTDVPLAFDLEACRTHDFNRDEVVEIFRELEFRTFLRELSAGDGEPDAPPSDGQQLSLFGEAPATSALTGAPLPEPVTATVIVRDAQALDALARRLEQAQGIAFDTETTSTDQMQAELVGISLAVEPGEGYYIPVGHQGGDASPQLPIETVVERLRPALTNPDIPKYGHNIKYDAVMLTRHGLDVQPLSFDTMIGEWLVRPDSAQRKLGLKAVAFFRLGVQMTEIADLLGTGKKQITMDLVPVDKAAPYAAADADMTLQLVAPIRKDLADQQLEKLFYEVEMPLVPVLADMEMAGVLVDVKLLEKMSAEIAGSLDEIVRSITNTVGNEFNLNSTQQLSEVLFEKLQLPTQGLRKTKSGYYSTAADVLDSTAGAGHVGRGAGHPRLPRVGEAALDLRRRAAADG